MVDATLVDILMMLDAIATFVILLLSIITVLIVWRINSVLKPLEMQLRLDIENMKDVLREEIREEERLRK